MLQALLAHQQATFQGLGTTTGGHQTEYFGRCNKTPVHRRRRSAVKKVHSAARTAERTTWRRLASSISREGNSPCGLEQNPLRTSSLHNEDDDNWTPKGPAYDLQRVAYGSESSVANTKQRATGEALWTQALVINGRVYFPKDLEFCQRVAAAATVGGGSGNSSNRISSNSNSVTQFHAAAPNLAS